MGPVFVYLLIFLTCSASIFRPFWGLAGYLFLLYLQPEWNWRWDGLYGLQYQKYVAIFVLIGTAMQGFQGNRIRGWAAASMFSLIGFLLLAWISSLQSLAPETSALYIDVLWKSVVVAFLAVRLADTPEKAAILMWAIVIGSGYNAFRINEDYFITGVTRYVNDNWGYKGDSNVYTLYTFPALTCSMVLFFTSTNLVSRLFAGSIAILHVHQLMLLESRGGLLGAALSGVLLVVLIRKSFQTNIAFLVAAVAVIVLAGPPVAKEFGSIFASTAERDSSASSRITLWKAAMQITSDYPMLGVGPNATQFFIPKYAVEFADLETKHPHNIFFEVLSGCGIPAFLLFVSFFAIPYLHILYCRREYLYDSDAATSIVLANLVTMPGFCVAGLFAGGGMIESLYFFVAIWIGGFLALETRKAGVDEEIDDEVECDAIEPLNAWTY